MGTTETKGGSDWVLCVLTDLAWLLRHVVAAC